MAYEHNNEASEINANGIRAKMRDDIFEEFKRLVKNQVEPWVFFNSGKLVRVKQFDGEDISLIGSGTKYNDQSKNVFLNHIEPFIEDVIKRKIDETIELAKDKKVPLTAVLGSTKANLSIGIDTVYHKIREIDGMLRGGGYPESVPMRDVSLEIKTMNHFLDRQIKIAEDLNFETPETVKKKPFYKTLWFYITSTLAFLLLLTSVILNLDKIKNIYSSKDTSEKTTSSKMVESNIFAEVSKDGEILRSNEFPWKIEKTKNKEGNIFYTIIDRSGDPTAVSVIPDTPKCSVRRSWDGMVIIYTCPEEQISNFTIRLKY